MEKKLADRCDSIQLNISQSQALAGAWGAVTCISSLVGPSNLDVAEGVAFQV